MANLANRAACLLHNAHLDFQKRKLGTNIDAFNESLRKRSFHRVPPKLTLLQQWHRMPESYRKLFCEHGHGFYEVCSGCKRNTKTAQANFKRLFAAGLR